jgi:catechol-2,3-dioxygenase
MAFVPDLAERVRPIGYAHVVLRTSQMDKMIEWYRSVIGLEVVLVTPVITFLTFDHSQDRLALMQSDDIDPAQRKNVDHIAYDYQSIEDVVAVYRRAGKFGVKPHWCINHGVATSMYYRDPDGNQIETSVTHFEDRDSVNGWLANGDFDRNPVGVTIDAEELALRVERDDVQGLLAPDAGHGDALASELALMRERG